MPSTQPSIATRYVNDVRLVGRVSHPGAAKELPSGDLVHSWRLVVPRDPVTRGARPTRRQPDVIDITCWSAATRRTAGRLIEGDVVEVEGALRRRFFRTPGGVGSRYEVEAAVVRRLGSVTPSAHD